MKHSIYTQSSELIFNREIYVKDYKLTLIARSLINIVEDCNGSNVINFNSFEIKIKVQCDTLLSRLNSNMQKNNHFFMPLSYELEHTSQTILNNVGLFISFMS